MQSHIRQLRYGTWKKAFFSDLPGTITTRALLDREVLDEYELVIEAVETSRGRDRVGSIRRSAQILVTIVVEDVNDTPPRLSLSPPLMYVQRGSGVGALLGKVTATDPDLEDRVTFELVEGPVSLDRSVT